jgi:hypothetical protein
VIRLAEVQSDMAYVVIALSFVRGLYLGLERSDRIPTAHFKISRKGAVVPVAATARGSAC